MTGPEPLASLAFLADVRGLHAYWDRINQPSPESAGDPTRDRLLLDTLGLGLEQTLRHLYGARPGFEAFLRWIVDIAGAPDPIAVARYHAALDGVTPPPEVKARLAAIDAMPAVLDAAALDQWARDGYVIVGRAVPPEAAAALAAMLWEAAGADPGDPSSWYRERAQGLRVGRFQHPTMAAARSSPRVHKAFAQLWGTSDLWTIIDELSFNPPVRAPGAFAAPRLHWDVSLVPPIPFATQGILYLGDTADDQGALELVPGFHHEIESWLAGLGDADPRAIDLSARARRIAANAGDLIIWRQDLPHGASPNTAARPRLAQYLNMYPASLRHATRWR